MNPANFYAYIVNVAPCPTCGADVGVVCKTLASGRYQHDPHTARRRLAEGPEPLPCSYRQPAVPDCPPGVDDCARCPKTYCS